MEMSLSLFTVRSVKSKTQNTQDSKYYAFFAVSYLFALALQPSPPPYRDRPTTFPDFLKSQKSSVSQRKKKRKKEIENKN